MATIEVDTFPDAPDTNNNLLPGGQLLGVISGDADVDYFFLNTVPEATYRATIVVYGDDKTRGNIGSFTSVESLDILFDSSLSGALRTDFSFVTQSRTVFAGEELTTVDGVTIPAGRSIQRTTFQFEAVEADGDLFIALAPGQSSLDSEYSIELELREGPPAASTDPCDLDGAIVGTANGDALSGNNADDTICGLGGADNIGAGGGLDFIFGGAGNDTLNGGGSRDVVNGDGGNDRMIGGGGADTMVGGAGNDTVLGAGGRDDIDGGRGKDSIDGGGGRDILNGNGGKDTIKGGSRDDTLMGGGGRDDLQGGRGDDLIEGGRGRDTLDGDDFFEGQTKPGDDTLKGEGGNDQLIGRFGDDVLEGGTGKDDLIGGSGRDSLFGGNGDDEIQGGEGRDTLFGGTGDDEIIGGKGNDFLTGGAGADVFDFSNELGSRQRDSITDFEVGVDTLRIDSDRSLTEADIMIFESILGTRVRFDKVTVILNDVDVADFTFDDVFLT